MDVLRTYMHVRTSATHIYVHALPWLLAVQVASYAFFLGVAHITSRSALAWSALATWTIFNIYIYIYIYVCIFICAHSLRLNFAPFKLVCTFLFPAWSKTKPLHVAAFGLVQTPQFFLKKKLKLLLFMRWYKKSYYIFFLFTSQSSHMPRTVTSKTSVESGGIVPLIPFLPYAAFGGTVSFLIPPTFIPTTPISHPWITSPPISPKHETMVDGRWQYCGIPWQKQEDTHTQREI